MRKKIKVVVEIDTTWFDPEEYNTKLALDKLEKDLHRGLCDTVGVPYSDIEMVKIEVID